ncbi:MAG: hypothetical protein Q6362_002830 [Candidatus Wukongarchaeota archaeon]|nr:hypothetical protein [Candidatus Wukongarchaeota archaeon]MDO8128367.1 hypothetical protein [Candidatus Wukongarchaeota archaeon]
MPASICKTDTYQWKPIIEKAELDKETILPCSEIPTAWCIGGICPQPCCKILEIGC